MQNGRRISWPPRAGRTIAASLLAMASALSFAADPDADGVAARDWRDDARVVVHAVAEAEPLVDSIVDLFERLGARRVERRTVDATPGDDQVRWFHAPDEIMAHQLVAVLEPVFGNVLVRDFSRYEPSPSSGLLELWLR